MRDTREINELQTLDDDVLVTTQEAAAFLSFTHESLRWYRNNRPECSPKFYKVGSRSIRYRIGDLRGFATGDRACFHAQPVEA